MGLLRRPPLAATGGVAALAVEVVFALATIALATKAAGGGDAGKTESDAVASGTMETFESVTSNTDAFESETLASPTDFTDAIDADALALSAEGNEGGEYYDGFAQSNYNDDCDEVNSNGNQNYSYSDEEFRRYSNEESRPKK